MKTRAAYLNSLNEPLVIDEVSIPELKDGQILVKLQFSGVCHSQLMEAKGLRGEDKYLPHMLGHEGAGIVIRTGSNVTKVKEGDAVVLTWIKGTGLENGGTQYKKNNLLINAGFVTTFMEYTVVSENRVVPFSKDIPMDIATLFGCAVPTGTGILLNQIQSLPGQTIVVWGLGGIGLSALMGTQIHDFSRIIAVDVSDEKLELAKNIGATDTINALKENAVTKILTLTDDQGVDFAVESAGQAKTIEQAYLVTKKFGSKCIFASHPKHGDNICIDPFHLICGKQIQGSWGGGTKPDRDIPRFIELYKSKKLNLDLMLSHKYSLANINAALNDLENKKINRALIDFSLK